MTEQEIQEKAKKAAGNWRSFDSFIWAEQPEEDADDWCLINIRSRDSEPIERANARAIEATLKPFTKGKKREVDFQRFNHWAVGWMDTVALRVYKKEKITKAFREMCILQDRMDAYPILDEELLAEEELEEEGCTKSES